MLYLLCTVCLRRIVTSFFCVSHLYHWEYINTGIHGGKPYPDRFLHMSDISLIIGQKMCPRLTNDSILPIHVCQWKHFSIKAWLVLKGASVILCTIYTILVAWNFVELEYMANFLLLSLSNTISYTEAIVLDSLSLTRSEQLRPEGLTSSEYLWQLCYALSFYRDTSICFNNKLSLFYE